jgi:asparagine synthase (glutamine-hydrolysing)
MRITDPAAGTTTEKWILRKACEDLLPAELVWRRKAQFDEGTGTVGALEQALARYRGVDHLLGREAEGEVYRELLCAQYQDPALVLGNAGQWAAGRVDLSGGDQP